MFGKAKHASSFHDSINYVTKHADHLDAYNFIPIRTCFSNSSKKNNFRIFNVIFTAKKFLLIYP
jgi:hypothetical protein